MSKYIELLTCVWRIADLCRKSVIRHTQAGFASAGLLTAEDAVFLIDSGDTSPSVSGVVIEICSAGDGSAAIFRSMPTNSRRVR
jgi:hypothetical protein